MSIYKSNKADFWPKKNGVDALTKFNPTLKIEMCKSCWNGGHDKDGCKQVGCECGCYRGRNKGLSRVHAPAKGEAPSFPGVGTIEIK
jgi:hypothetical protein